MLDAIDVVAGDLLDLGKGRADDQNPWIRFMHANMDPAPGTGLPTLLDAYSIHVYWEPQEFPDKPVKRLRTLATTINDLPSERAVYVTEYGVRRLVNPQFRRPGTIDGLPGGTKMEQSPEAAFQHAWFNALAPQCGCAGLAKWVLYRTDLPKTGWGEWGMIDSPDEGRLERTPVYRLTRLFTHSVGRHWMATGLGQSPDPAVMASRFLAPNGDDQTVIVLNGHDRPQDVRVGSLRKQRTYFRADWNRDTAGGLLPLDPKSTGEGQTLTVTVPARGVLALSTLPMGL
jgi:hypothetical protein